MRELAYMCMCAHAGRRADLHHVVVDRREGLRHLRRDERRVVANGRLPARPPREPGWGTCFRKRAQKNAQNRHKKNRFYCILDLILILKNLTR
jgi:hypothetical protein